MLHFSSVIGDRKHTHIWCWPQPINTQTGPVVAHHSTYDSGPQRGQEFPLWDLTGDEFMSGRHAVQRGVGCPCRVGLILYLCSS